MADERDVATAFLGTQKGESGGAVIGPKLLGSLFVPPSYGIVFQDSNGNFWKQSLALDANGNTALDESGFPTLALQQVTLP